VSSGLLFILVPMVALGGCALVLTVVLTAVPARALQAPTAAARRHAVWGGTPAVLLAAAAMLVTGVCALRLPLNTQARAGLLVLAPSAAGAVHAAVLLVTELTWPRPGEH
jgi:hypothetical protein